MALSTVTVCSLLFIPEKLEVIVSFKVPGILPVTTHVGLQSLTYSTRPQPDNCTDRCKMQGGFSLPPTEERLSSHCFSSLELAVVWPARLNFAHAVNYTCVRYGAGVSLPLRKFQLCWRHMHVGALSYVCQTAGIIGCGAARWTVSTLNCDEDCVVIAVVSHHGAQCIIIIV